MQRGTKKINKNVIENKSHFFPWLPTAEHLIKKAKCSKPQTTEIVAHKSIRVAQRIWTRWCGMHGADAVHVNFPQSFTRSQRVKSTKTKQKKKKATTHYQKKLRYNGVDRKKKGHNEGQQMAINKGIFFKSLVTMMGGFSHITSASVSRLTLLHTSINGLRRGREVMKCQMTLTKQNG